MNRLAKILAFGLSLGVLTTFGHPTALGAGEKITICHKGSVTMSVSAKSFVGHAIQHRDSLGPC